MHIGGIVIEAEQIVTPPQDLDDDVIAEEYEEENESNGFPFGNIALVLLFAGGMVFAYFLGKKGIAMFNAMKKAACVLLLFGMMFDASHAVYAADLPPYSFGMRNNQRAVHIDTRATEQSTSSTVVHMHPTASSTPSHNTDRVIHFDPRRLANAVERVERLKHHKGITIYAQAERNEHLGIIPNRIQLEFARYVYSGIFRTVTWWEYCKSKKLST